MFRSLLISILLFSWAAMAQSKTAAQPRQIAQSLPDDDVEDDFSGPDAAPPQAPPAVAPTTERSNKTTEFEPEKPHANQGEPLFDWSKYQGQTQVPHPNAEKGLIRIDKNDIYYYKVEESGQDKAFAVNIGMMNPYNLKNPDSDNPALATFAHNYEQASNPLISFMKEWQIWRGALGKFGIQAGTGFFVAQGHGHFVSAVNAALTPRETLTFIALPNSVGAVYRMQFKTKQLFVPYGMGGGIAMTFSEIRDDNIGPKFGGALDAYVGAGLAVNMTYFDYMTRIQLDREYGIHNIYLMLEYRKIIAITQRYDFSSDYINGGFLMEY